MRYTHAFKGDPNKPVEIDDKCPYCGHDRAILTRVYIHCKKCGHRWKP